jgi:hypothetical protein
LNVRSSFEGEKNPRLGPDLHVLFTLVRIRVTYKTLEKVAGSRLALSFCPLVWASLTSMSNDESLATAMKRVSLSNYIN